MVEVFLFDIDIDIDLPVDALVLFNVFLLPRVVPVAGFALF